MNLNESAPALTLEPADLSEFLLALYAADEAKVRAWLATTAVGDHADWCREQTLYKGRCDGCGAPATPGEPSRQTLAGWGSRRRVVELHALVAGKFAGDDKVCASCGDQGCCGHDVDYPCDTLKALAMPYADHPDFRPAWRA